MRAPANPESLPILFFFFINKWKMFLNSHVSVHAATQDGRQYTVKDRVLPREIMEIEFFPVKRLPL